MQEIAAESAPYAANRARATWSAIFSWALGEVIALSNPVVGAKKSSDEVSRDRVLSDKELAALWKAHGQIRSGSQNNRI